MLVRILECAAKESVCTCGKKRGRERVKEYRIKEILDKKRNIIGEVSILRYFICR